MSKNRKNREIARISDFFVEIQNPVYGSFICDCATNFTLDATNNVCKRDCDIGYMLQLNNLDCVACAGPGANLSFDECVCTAQNSTLNADADTCVCDDGYQTSQDGELCEDIDECTTDTAGCNTISEVCVNNDGSYSCDCAIEFTLDTEDNICKINCESGFIRHSNNTACVEIIRHYVKKVMKYLKTVSHVTSYVHLIS